MKFRVWTYDVWGNEKDGYEVNDRTELTEYFGSDVNLLEVKDNSESSIVKALKDNGWLKKQTQLRHLSFDGDGENISIDQARNSYPLFGLELVKDGE